MNLTTIIMDPLAKLNLETRLKVMAQHAIIRQARRDALELLLASYSPEPMFVEKAHSIRLSFYEGYEEIYRLTGSKEFIALPEDAPAIAVNLKFPYGRVRVDERGRIEELIVCENRSFQTNYLGVSQDDNLWREREGFDGFKQMYQGIPPSNSTPSK